MKMRVQSLFLLSLLLSLGASALPFGTPQQQAKPAATESAGQSGPTAAASASRPAADLLLLNVAVMDSKGRFITGLSREAFTVFDGKTQQPIHFFSDEASPVSVGLILDWSGSMVNWRGSSRGIEAVLVPLWGLIREAHPSSEFFVEGFNAQPQIITDWTRDRMKVAEGLKRLAQAKTFGQTALFDAFYLGIDKATRGANRLRAVILVTDGADNGSRYKFNELTRLARESDVLIYVIAIVPTEDSTFSEAGVNILKEIAVPTGGEVLLPRNSGDIAAAFEKIALELRTRYTLGIKPAPAMKSGEWRRLKIEVKPPPTIAKAKLHARTREGYYPTETLR